MQPRRMPPPSSKQNLYDSVFCYDFCTTLNRDQYQTLQILHDRKTDIYNHNQNCPEYEPELHCWKLKAQTREGAMLVKEFWNQRRTELERICANEQIDSILMQILQYLYMIYVTNWSYCWITICETNKLTSTSRA